MRKLLRCSLLSILLPTSACAQSLFTFAGGNMSGSGLEVSWSVGEIVITTAENGNTVVTQGYQQPVDAEDIIMVTDSTFNFITANDDGINDYFLIDNVENLPDNYLIIINRWREVVYKQEGYRNDWYGKGLNDQLLPQAAYYYSFYCHKDDRKPCLRGTIHVLRQ